MIDIERLLVVGAGAMGAQIAMLGALAGYTTVLNDVDPAALERAEAQLRGRMARNVEKGRMTQAEVDAALDRLVLDVNLDTAGRGVDLVIEAIVEQLDAKASLFARLSAIVPSHCIFATNSSSIVASLLGERTDRPGRTINMHFFNPPLVMDCVEVVGPGNAEADVVDAAAEVCRRMGKTPVVLEHEIPGFVANRILSAIVREASSLLEGGYASAEAIDDICRGALRHPMGPFELLDMAGLDVNQQMQELIYMQTHDEADQPQQLVVDLVAQNHLGQKTGQGFYRYENGRKVSA